MRSASDAGPENSLAALRDYCMADCAMYNSGSDKYVCSSSRGIVCTRLFTEVVNAVTCFIPHNDKFVLYVVWSIPPTLLTLVSSHLNFLRKHHFLSRYLVIFHARLVIVQRASLSSRRSWMGEGLASAEVVLFANNNGGYLTA